MIIVGFIIAVITAFIQGIVEIKLKKPLYKYIHKIQNNENYKNDCFYKFMIFILNILYDLDKLWLEILSATIGWSLLSPNQTKYTLSQLGIASLGSIAFVFFGLFTRKYKTVKQNKIFNQMNIIKNDKNIYEKENMLMNKTRKLILYDQLIYIYNTAFAISISFAWETFASLALESTYKGVKNIYKLFIIEVVYTVTITCVYIQLGLQLTDIIHDRRDENAK
eukprot:115329_1